MSFENCKKASVDTLARAFAQLRPEEVFAEAFQCTVIAAMNTIIDFLNKRPACRVALAVHQRPDGDALGSGTGLAGVLEERGYHARIVNAMPLPADLSFMLDPRLHAYHDSTDWWKEYDCLGVLDCGEEGRLDEINRCALEHLPTFTIDHHASSPGLGEARWIEPDASSTGEMVVRLCRTAGWPLRPASAQALWTAVVTDTGRFSFENTTADALEAARDCVLAGASPAVAAASLYQSVSLAERRLQRLALDRMELFADNRMAVTWLVASDFADVGCGVAEAKNLVNILRDTKGVEVGIFLYEVPGGGDVKASFRTRSPHDAISVTRRFGGGGHQRAAGCSYHGSMEAAKKAITEAALETYFISART